jgi:hypothetical protein
MADNYRGAYISEIQTALAGKPSVDLYVRIEHADKYLIFLRKDQPLSSSKLENLIRLSASSLFVLESGDERNGRPMEVAAPSQELPEPIAFLDPKSSFRNEILGAEATSIILSSYKNLVATDDLARAAVPQKLINMSESMLQALAPETVDLRQSLVKHLSNLQVMNHAAGITTLALLVALANEFTSRTALRQLSQACVLMDISLAELDPSHLELYYSDRKLLPAHVQEIVKQHPVRSHQLLSKYPEVSDSVGQLILLHHELHNGKGYHRGIRTINVLPLARVLALGVDLYEQIKNSELNKGGRSIRQILVDLRESAMEPHMRRHAAGLIENVLKYLRIT